MAPKMKTEVQVFKDTLEQLGTVLCADRLNGFLAFDDLNNVVVVLRSTMVTPKMVVVKVNFLGIFMDSPQSVVSPFKSYVVAESEQQQKSELFTRNSGGLSDGSEVNTKEADVYAKLCLTSDPESTVSTKIINGGGRDPVFNENLRLKLLGFALVPLSEVLLKNGKLEKEFSLSSTDLFHSPAEETMKDSKISECELEKIEFPDPKIVNENQMMVSEYFGIPCFSLDSESSRSLVISNAENRVSLDMAVNVVESFSTATVNSIPVPKLESPPSSVSTNWVSSPSGDGPAASKTSMEEHISTSKEKTADARDADSSSSRARCDSIEKPFVSVNIEPEQKVVQQEIVDMYMKSMQQFTESLAKMKLPLDIDKGATKLENSSTTTDKKNTGIENHRLSGGLWK
ncbi:hypothetical protein CXB51_034279 [Gossypium anomalum]|uniref:C2 domain-containing protein n=1 Tax=Gossypium anomalum TaxID=47600 RepID=A0A8J5XXA0_9ROSI|nr:hypothetical protein CXB51_034279 [Gossypium anomalum]